MRLHAVGAVIASLMLLFDSHTVHAQSVCNNPYDSDCAALLAKLYPVTPRAETPPPPAACLPNPYAMAMRQPAVQCVAPDAAGIRRVVTPTVHSIGEGVVHAPGSELAFLILTNFDSTAQGVEVQYLIQGEAQPVWRHYVVQGFERTPILVHDDPLFAGLRTFTVRAFWPGEGSTQLVMRPAADPFSHATIPPVMTKKPTPED